MDTDVWLWLVHRSQQVVWSLLGDKEHHRLTREVQAMMELRLRQLEALHKDEICKEQHPQLHKQNIAWMANGKIFSMPYSIIFYRQLHLRPRSCSTAKFVHTQRQ